ncbi:hypothetical protein [Nocardioides sp. ChNu-99]|uniref:hypothetical protein n=1 Tax=Nocardioides sp. ChNu-99 TaxID=2839897 RepID=UPI0024067E03|nr:hypothetical protein [Nocardioides sp. ChNu-99]MDF9716044.1 hypothetical protein [Nocardioides sp. ChNu-99]
MKWVTKAQGLVVAAALVAGCSGESSDGGEADSTPSASASPQEQETTDEVETATPEQLASIIAGGQSDWRAVIDTASGCRLLWTTAYRNTDPAVDLEAKSCYMREIVLNSTSGDALYEMEALTPPESMEDLVSETEAVLREISTADLEPDCGPPLELPATSTRCNQTLGELYVAYLDLEEALDSWTPYL